MSTEHVDTSSKALGERAEGEIVATVDGLEPVEDQEAEHYDAVPSTAISPSEDLPMGGICVLERGVPVEIKTTIPRLSSGKRGMFYLRKGQHDRLVDDGGCYLFGVTRPHERKPLALKVWPARAVDELVESWRNAGEDRQSCSQVSWTNVFNPDELREKPIGLVTGYNGP